MPIHTEPCTPWEFTPDCCNVPDGTTQEQIDRARRIATAILWRASGMRWGPSCPYEVRPCRRSCLDDYPLRIDWSGGSGGLYPYIGTDGLWRNASPCSCSTDCSCGELCEIVLQGPIHTIVSVQDGETLLPPEAYRVDNGNRLVRLDGNCWESCYDLAAAPGEPGTLTVTYTVGLPLDDAALHAFSVLVCHLLKDCGTGCGCALSSNRNVSRVSRQGVNLEFAEAGALYTEGRLGIPAVDRWIMLVNPYNLTSPSRVLSPDARRQRVTTWRA